MNVIGQLKKGLILAYLTGLVWLRRDPTSAAYLASTPFALVFLIFMTSRGALFTNAITGAIVMLVMHHGLSLGSDATLYRIEYKLQDIMVASPISPIAYVAGLAMSQIVFAAPAAILLSLPLVQTIGNVAQVLVLIGSVLLVWVSGSSLGFLFSTYVPHVRNAAQVTALLSGLMTILPPVFYPIEILPPALQQLAYLVPTTHASLLMLYAMGRQAPASWNPFLGILILGGYAIFFIALTVFKARWRQT